MNKRPHWFPFEPDEFCADGAVAAMSTPAVGAFILLRCKAWRESPPCTVPDNDPVLARWARLSLDDWMAVKGEVVAAWTLIEGRWSDKSLRTKWDTIAAKSNKASESANARWGNKERNAGAMRSHKKRKATEIPRASESESESESSQRSGRSVPGRENSALSAREELLSDLSAADRTLVEGLEAAAIPCADAIRLVELRRRGFVDIAPAALLELIGFRPGQASSASGSFTDERIREVITAAVDYVAEGQEIKQLGAVVRTLLESHSRNGQVTPAGRLNLAVKRARKTHFDTRASA